MNWADKATCIFKVFLLYTTFLIWKLGVDTLTASSHPCARLMQCIKAVLTALKNQDKNPNLRNCHSLIEYLQSGEQGRVVSAGCTLAVCESHPSHARGDHSQNQQPGTGELLQPLSRSTCCAHSTLTPLWQKQTAGTTLGVWKYTGAWMKNGNFYSVLSGQVHAARNYIS